VNSCGYNTAEKHTQTLGNDYNIADFLLVQLSVSRFFFCNIKKLSWCWQQARRVY